jgi:chromosome segregation ATPase
LQHQLNEVQGKLDETNRTLNDFDSAKKKLSIENSDLLRQLEEAESQVSQLSKLKISLTTQLEDTKRLADEESRVSSFVTRFVLRKELGFYDTFADSLTVKVIFVQFVIHWML